MAGNARSPAAGALVLCLVLVLLLSPAAAAAARCPGNFCRCMQGCTAERKTLEECTVRCFTSKLQEEVAVAVAVAAVPPTSSSRSAPNSIAWGDFCRCMCDCMLRCIGRGKSLKICALECVFRCSNFTAGVQQRIGTSTA